jgi:hypothetical protein
MVRTDPTLVFDLARQHQHDIMAEAERDRLVRAARPRRLASAGPARMSARHWLAAVWCYLGSGLGRIAETWRVETSGQL